MRYSPRHRFSLKIPSGRKGPHLFVLLTDLIRDGGARKALLVNLSSVRPGKSVDSSCILLPGDHPSITRRSFIRYGKGFARIETENTIIRNVRKGNWIPKADFTPDVFARICKGLEISPETRTRIRRFYNLAKRRGAGP